MAVWSTAQDTNATIKRQLQRLVPLISVFLDVDDLEDIGALETYIDQSAVINIFLSHGCGRLRFDSAHAPSDLRRDASCACECLTLTLPRLLATLPMRVRPTRQRRSFLADFKSTNCLREVRSTIDKKKPLMLTHEPDAAKGGGPLDIIATELDEEALRTAVFSEGRFISSCELHAIQNRPVPAARGDHAYTGPRPRTQGSHV